MLNSNCSAQKLVAADYATNSSYASGWTNGQNGGYGWGPWSTHNTGFGGSPSNSVMNAMDHTSPYNPFGVAWTLYDLQGSIPGAASPGQCYNPPTGTDISRAGRAFPNGSLQPGQTFSTVLSNPTDRAFFRGYTLVLSTGGDNLDYSKVGTEISVGIFQYNRTGAWYTGPTFSTGGIPLLDTDTTTNGVQIDITMTGTNSYHLLMTPVGNPSLAYTEDSDTVTNSVNWVTYQLYNTDSDFYPTLAPCGPDRTDFYIKSMTVSGLNLDIQQAGTNVLLSWPNLFTNFTLVSSTNPSVPGWSPVSTNPAIINGQNVVTNPITGKQQFFRLQFQQQQ
jgi:hypothetical protein